MYPIFLDVLSRQGYDLVIITQKMGIFSNQVFHFPTFSFSLQDLVRVIQQESYTYKDPITEFLAHLYVDFDFDAAQEKLQQCAAVLENDFFLVACQTDFIENARLMIFELFCRIHQCISIK